MVNSRPGLPAVGVAGLPAVFVAGRPDIVCVRLRLIPVSSLCAMRHALCAPQHPLSFHLSALSSRESLLLSFLFVPTAVAQEMSAAGKIKMADAASILAVKQAAESRATCNPALLKRAAESINQAAVLISEVVVEADNTGNLSLAQEVYDMAANIVGQGIGFIKEVCMHCVRTSPAPGAVSRFQPACSGAAEAEKLNNETIDAALAAGAIPPRPEPEAP